MRGTPGARHFSPLSVSTWRALRSFTLAWNSGLYFGKSGSGGLAGAGPWRGGRAPAPVAPRRPAGAQPRRHNEPSGSFCGRTNSMPPR